MPETFVMPSSDASVDAVPPPTDIRFTDGPLSDTAMYAMASPSGANAGLSGTMSGSVIARDSGSFSERTRIRPPALYASFVPSRDIAISC